MEHCTIDSAHGLIRWHFEGDTRDEISAGYDTLDDVRKEMEREGTAIDSKLSDSDEEAARGLLSDVIMNIPVEVLAKMLFKFVSAAFRRHTKRPRVITIRSGSNTIDLYFADGLTLAEQSIGAWVQINVVPGSTISIRMD